MPLLDVKNLKTFFHTRNGVIRAVDDVSFHLEKGETLGIVGESGSGKSVTCYSLLGLLPKPPARIESGSALFDGQDLLHLPPPQLRSIRGRRIAMIFQDPMTSLNPYLKIGKQLIEPLLVHNLCSKEEALQRAVQALREVGIQAPETRLDSYPHQFSGGMRQRVMIAMAIITQPDLLIADEPTTALDVTVQAQILELIRKLQQDHHMAVILVSHDLGVVSGFCDRVQVMYAGRIVEASRTDALYYQPKHPYNEALQQSIPGLQPKGKELFTIPGLPPDLSKRITGCPFAPRCTYAADECRQDPIQLLEVEPHHTSACLRVQQKEIHLPHRR